MFVSGEAGASNASGMAVAACCVDMVSSLNGCMERVEWMYGTRRVDRSRVDSAASDRDVPHHRAHQVAAPCGGGNPFERVRPKRMPCGIQIPDAVLRIGGDGCASYHRRLLRRICGGLSVDFALHLDATRRARGIAAESGAVCVPT